MPLPTSISINTFGTHKIAEDKIIKLVREVFDLRPYAITKMLEDAGLRVSLEQGETTQSKAFPWMLATPDRLVRQYFQPGDHPSLQAVDRWLLEIKTKSWHTFKDFGARFLAACLQQVGAADGLERTILVARRGHSVDDKLLQSKAPAP